MQNVQRRLASTATAQKLKPTIPLSSARTFPPPQALAPKGSKSPVFFDSDTWAVSQPPPPAALTAFAHRVGLGKLGTNPKLIQQVCTHESITLPFSTHHPNKPLPLTNANFATLGNSLLGLFATEFVHASYPHLPTRVVKAAVSAYVGATTCADVARDMGAAPLLRWYRAPHTPLRPAVLHHEALSSVSRALVALVYQERSVEAAKKFTHDYFLSREIDLRAMIKFSNPKKALALTVEKFGRERPVSRLLKETGRFSVSPVFVVGIYSGRDQLGEGFGSSLSMAEFRAAEDALQRLYLTRTPPDQLQLPSQTFANDVFTGLSSLKSTAYTPGELGHAEVNYGSAGRSSILNPSNRRLSEEEMEED